VAAAGNESLWAKLARRLGRKRSTQSAEGNDSDAQDDMRRAGDAEPDKDAAFEEMLRITYRSKGM
jgi:hypothetical protein